MDKSPPEQPKTNTPSSNDHFHVMSNDSREDVLALARALARQAVAEYLDGTLTESR